VTGLQSLPLTAFSSEQCSFRTAPLALIHYIGRIKSAMYGPCWRKIFRRSKFLDFVIILVLYRCSIISFFSAQMTHTCAPLFVSHNTIQSCTCLLMTFINQVWKALAKFTVELFGGQNYPLISEHDPLFKGQWGHWPSFEIFWNEHWVRVILCATPNATRARSLYGLIRKTCTHVPLWDSNPQRKDHQVFASKVLNTTPRGTAL
jgi:hypothetical protein